LAFFNASPSLVLLAVDSKIGLLRHGLNEGRHLFFLGSLNSIYPLFQWLACPFIGALADRFSRRHILLIVTIANCVGYFLVGYGTSLISIKIVVIGLIIPALSGGIFPIVKTALSDLSSRESRVFWFNRVALVKAAATIGGPLLSVGFIGSGSLVPSFFISMCLSAIAFILAIFLIKDSRSMQKNTAFRSPPLINLSSVLIFSVFFFLVAGWWSYVKFAPALLGCRFHLDRSFFYYFLSILGVVNIATQSVLLKFPIRWMAPLFPALALTIGLQIVPFPIAVTFALFFASIFFQGCLMPHTESLISCLADADNQGKMQGFAQSAEAAGRSAGPFLAGIASLQHSSLPIVLSALLILMAFFTFQKIKQKTETRT